MTAESTAHIHRIGSDHRGTFRGVEAHPTLVEQAVARLEHLAMNHPLLDTNERAAFLLTAPILEAWGIAERDRWGCDRACRGRRGRRGPPQSRSARTRPGDVPPTIPRIGDQGSQIANITPIARAEVATVGTGHRRRDPTTRAVAVRRPSRTRVRARVLTGAT